MKVLIVAKTRQGSGACVGGITFELHILRMYVLSRDAGQQKAVR